MLIANKIKESSPRNLALVTFGKLIIVFLTEVNLLRPSFDGPEVLSSVSDKAKLVIMSKNSNLWHLIYPSVLTGFSMLVFFTKSSFMRFSVVYVVLWCHFSVNESFEWFLTRSNCKNIQSGITLEQFGHRFIDFERT